MQVTKKDEITIEDFQKLDIRIGRVLEATEVEGSEKMIRCVVDLGEEIGKRIIFSGIRKWYMPEDLVGKLLPYVVNIKSRPMFGEESQGMLVATGDEEAILIEPDKKVDAGTKIH
jgi:methionine--tRNA ligase beta chain